MKLLHTLWAALAAIVVSAPVFAQEEAEPEIFVRYSQDGGEISWGMLHGDQVWQLEGAPYETMEHTGVWRERDTVKLEAPADPTQIFMTAFNFRSHISGDPVEEPGLFIVPPSSLVGPEDPIVRPAGSQNLHYEAEMAVVIGKRAENVSVEDAHEYIFGVTAGNDVSERAWQAGDIQWVRAKGSRGFNAVGPGAVQGRRLQEHPDHRTPQRRSRAKRKLLGPALRHGGNGQLHLPVYHLAAGRHDLVRHHGQYPRHGPRRCLRG